VARSSAKVCSIDSRHIVCVSVRRQPLPVKQTRDLYLFDCPSRQVLGSRSLPCEAGFHTGSKVCIYVLRTLGPLVCCRNGLEDFFARKRPIFLPHCRISGHGGRLDQSRLPASGVTVRISPLHLRVRSYPIYKLQLRGYFLYPGLDDTKSLLD
jgi:hypothetical protein